MTGHRLLRPALLAAVGVLTTGCLDLPEEYLIEDERVLAIRVVPTADPGDDPVPADAGHKVDAVAPTTSETPFFHW